MSLETQRSHYSNTILSPKSPNLTEIDLLVKSLLFRLQNKILCSETVGFAKGINNSSKATKLSKYSWKSKVNPINDSGIMKSFVKIFQLSV